MPDERDALAAELHELHESIEDFTNEMAFFRKACYAILTLAAAGLGIDLNLLI